MSKITKLLFKGKETDDLTEFPNWRVGVSVAADWSWGVSIAVGIGIMYRFGFLPFLIWTTGNILALPLFGAVRRYMPLSRFWPTFIPLVLIFIMVEYFAIILNLHAILDGFSGGKEVSSFVFLSKDIATWVTIAIGFFIVWYVHKGGLRILMFTDLGWFTVQMFAVIFMAIAAYFLSGDKMNNVAWVKPGGIEWAIWGFLGIIVGALSAGHQWQKYGAIKEENILPVTLWGGGFFAFYMLFVALTGFFFSKHIILGISFLILMISLATSTIDSAVAAIRYVLARFGVKSKPLASILGLVIICTWPLAISSITSLWTLMAKIRFPVMWSFIIITLILTLKKGEIGRLIRSMGKLLRLKN